MNPTVERRLRPATRGAVHLVYGCRLGLEPGWRPCRRELCRSRPCWVARFDGRLAWVLPFSRDVWRSPLAFRRGQGGLAHHCVLLPSPIRLYAADLGPRVSWLDPEDVGFALAIARPKVERAISEAGEAGEADRERWLATLALIAGEEPPRIYR